jgi:hypothetical protein
MMTAKFVVTGVIEQGEPKVSEILQMQPVTSKPFDAEGASEDNSFARWTPSGNLEMTVNNPALFGRIKVGDAYRLTFDKCE